MGFPNGGGGGGGGIPAAHAASHFSGGTDPVGPPGLHIGAAEAVHAHTITPNTSNATGAVSIDAGGQDLVIADMTLTGNTTLTTTGYLNTPNRYTFIYCRVHQAHSGGPFTFTFSDTITWLGGFGAAGFPVIPTVADGVVEFGLYSLDGGTTKLGICSQPIRKHIVPVGATLVDATDALDADYFDFDARILKVRPAVGGVPVTNPTVFDLFMGVGQAAAATIYSTTGNRPSVAAGNRTNAATALPDTIAIAPGNYLRGKCITASSATNGLIIVTCIEAG